MIFVSLGHGHSERVSPGQHPRRLAAAESAMIPTRRRMLQATGTPWSRFLAQAARLMVAQKL